jgi:hypothetical protein
MYQGCSKNQEGLTASTVRCYDVRLRGERISFLYEWPQEGLGAELLSGQRSEAIGKSKGRL